jgi:hypothetical protein
MKSEVLASAGDVLLEEATLISMVSGRSMDVTNQIIGVHIFEDLFSPFISGNLILKESIDILNNLPLMGQEYLQLKIRTPTMEDKDAIQGLFYVYNITDRAFVAERNVVYKLNFISYFALTDSNTKLSKPFEGKVSDIAKTILTNWVGEASIGQIETTRNATKYVSNYWPPVKNLNYITNQAINTNSSPSYLFYQDRLGFNFKSLSSLYAADTPYPAFNFNMKGREISPSGDSARNIQRDYSRMTSIDFPRGFDTLSKLGRGTYASTLHTHDLVTKQYKEKKFNYQDDFDKKGHLNKFPITAKSTGFIFGPASAILVDEIHFGVYNGYGDISNSDIMQERLSILNMADAMKVTVVVPGRTDYTVGQKVWLEIVEPEPLDDKDTVEAEQDKLFSGYYLIGAINHNINREKHECTMELIKDSLLKTADQK